MDDLIRRSDVIKVVRHITFECIDADTRQELIEAIPTIEPKRGEWLWDDGYFCSECHGDAFSQKFTMLVDEPIYFLSDFCPHCGADMREREGE